MEKTNDSVIQMSEERRQEMLGYRQLSKEDLIPICRNWTKRDWIDYYACVGTMSLDEFCQRLLGTNDDKAEGLAKHSRGCKPAAGEIRQNHTPKG